MPTLKLTQAAIVKLPAPAAGRIEYWDALLPGFGVRVAAAQPGREPLKTWQVMYRVAGKLVREKLGTTFSVPKVEAARELARASMQKARAGINPVEQRQAEHKAEERRARAEKRRQTETLGAAIDRYLIDGAGGRWRKSKKAMSRDYYIETRRTLEIEVRPLLGACPIREITRRDVRELIDGIVDRGSPGQANHTLAYLRAMLNWAVERELIAANPIDKMPLPAPLRERDRALDDDEIRLFWRGCEAIGWPFGPLFQLLLLTAQRRGEMAEATYGEIDMTARLWTLPRERAKNDKAHVVHLSGLACGIIEALPIIGDKGLLFTTTGESPVSNFGHAREKVAAAMLEERKAEPSAAGRAKAAEAAAIDPFTVHDLRRTAATGMAALGVAHHVVDRVLNHTGGKISGVARIYNRFEYLAERQAALDAWSRHVEELVRPAPSNVVALAAAREAESAHG